MYYRDEITQDVAAKLLNKLEQLSNKKEKMVKEIKLPKWFNGQVYDEGATVTNRFGGDSCYLNAEELSMYDFIIGASTLMEMGMYAPKKNRTI